MIVTACEVCGDRRERDEMVWDAECNYPGPFCRRCASPQVRLILPTAPRAPALIPCVFSKRKKAPKPPAGEPWVYVGRPSPFGNPFPLTIGRYDSNPIEEFRKYLRASPRLVERVRAELAGKHLVCWCAPKPCHADVLLRVAAGEDP